MSILDEIEKQCNLGELQLLEPVGPRAHLVPMEERRKLYVTTDLARYFDKPHSLPLHADLNVYVLGEDINVALALDHIDCRMARLDPPRADVWEIRFYEHDPQLRLFGRFAVTDLFVALRGPVRRNEVKGKGFDRLRDDTLAEWQRLFGFNPPEILGSGDEHDYISKNVHLIGHA